MPCWLARLCGPHGLRMHVQGGVQPLQARPAGDHRAAAPEGCRRARHLRGQGHPLCGWQGACMPADLPHPLQLTEKHRPNLQDSAPHRPPPCWPLLNAVHMGRRCATSGSTQPRPLSPIVVSPARALACTGGGRVWGCAPRAGAVPQGGRGCRGAAAAAAAGEQPGAGSLCAGSGSRWPPPLLPV